MENSENQNSENSVQPIETSEKIGKKNKAERKKKNTDSINLDGIKINLSKGKKSLLDKVSVSSKREIYKGTDLMNQEEKKKFRGKIRRTLRSFTNSILGKDRSEKERTESVKSFLKFYKENWKIQDFKIENFSQSKDEMDLKDYKNLLIYLQSVLG